MKLCKTCVSKKNLKTITTTKSKKKLWKEGFGTTSEFPHDKRPNLKNIKTKRPKNYDLVLTVEKKEFANRYVFYYASKKNDTCNKPNKWNKAYNNFQNSGISKFDKDGKTKLYLITPQPYIEDGEDYFPHVHFLVTNKDNSKWNNKIYTKAVIVKINKNKMTEYVKKGCHVILNALPYHYYVKSRIPKSLPMPHKIVGNKLEKQHIVKYFKKMLVHYPIVNKMLKDKKIKIEQIPIVTYCYSKTCNASEKLMNKLWNMGFTNIVEYPGGIMEWTN